ncbi:alternative ribosome rescue aminoacyl-tRNA hydrolase ArfB [Urechidicola croceus]|uniref:Aminoacyl-tRNA hydrolase n=1 Tax=Urechidicola croceus TaxID=1850246 RepID=A0A1D8PAB2_9FLAO|nr:alternative ribosome rescue aminoacyl-tRNA hydrolase ArfB [Urechidicola croceus]AOW21503.1 aminoacyl-tRNA hydrolase [Urechidicola croceus]
MNSENLIKELNFKAIRSSGAGGQHVNKVSSKIVLFFDITNSQILSEEQKEILISNIKTRLTSENVLIINCDENRSQHKNKEVAIDRFLQIISNGLKVRKQRKKTKPSKSSIKKRLEKKRKVALKKAYRKKPNLE